MICLGLITPNNIERPNIDKSYNKYVTLIDVNPDKQIISDYIINNLNATEQSLIQSSKCYETFDFTYYCMYCLESYERNEKDINSISSYLSLGKETVYGKSIILKVDRNNNNCNITIDEILKIIINNLYNYGFTITTKDEILRNSFDNNPFETLDFDKNDLISYNFKLYDHVIKICFEIHPRQNEINKIATCITKIRKIHGNVFICIVKQYGNATVKYLNISQEDFTKLLILLTNVKIKNDTSLETLPSESSFFVEVNKLINQKKLHEICYTIPDDIINMPTYNSCIIPLRS